MSFPRLSRDDADARAPASRPAPAAGTPLLEVTGLRHVYPSGQREVTAIDGIDLAVQPGEFVSICGPSGCGKTTLLEDLAGLRRPTAGAVRLRGEVITGPQKAIGIVFQEESTFPWRTVLENVEFGLQMEGVERSARRERALAMIRLVGLSGFESAYPHQLSGGMKQRVAIARTLVLRPEIVVMDEPFGALDEQTRLILGAELLRIVTEAGTTVAFVTHSIQEAALLSDRIVLLTARPARVKTVIESTLAKPRTADLLATSEFAAITQQVWASLGEEALSSFADQADRR